MSAVVTFVTGRILPDRVREVADPYREALKGRPPPDLEQTFLLQKDGGQLAILSVWTDTRIWTRCSRPARNHLRVASIRAAGGTPEVSIYEVLVR